MTEEYEIEETIIETPDETIASIEIGEVATIERTIELMGSQNIAQSMTDQELNSIAQKVIDDYDDDVDSLSDWLEQYESALKLARQLRDEKNFPWPNASNVKYPLIGQAAISFNARAYPEVVQGDKVVKTRTIGVDPNDEKSKRGERVSRFMSWQLLEQVPNWDRDTDTMLIQLPIVGTMFREVSWDDVEGRPRDELLLPDEIVINYHAKSVDLQKCRRISKEITLFMNDIKERERMGLWNEVSYSKSATEGDCIEEDEQVFIHQLRYLDLDKDGYEEPYAVTVHKDLAKVVRIVAIYDEAGLFVSDNGEVARIEPYKIYSDFHFIPSFDGGFYSIGFGQYLYAINCSIDTTLNQLIDAGTLSNTQAGFLGKGLRTRAGQKPFQPGEWRPVETKGMDLRANIVPLPTQEPSTVLYQLMMFLVDVGKQMSSNVDVLSGVPQGVNTPVGTTMAMIEQGMKEIDAAYKRVYRGLMQEYKMLYRLNSIHVNDELYQRVLDEPADMAKDFNMQDMDIIPVGDQRVSTQLMRVIKAQNAREIAMSTPGANVQEASKRVLEAMDIQGVDQIIPDQPDAMQLMQMVEMLKGQVQQYEQFIQSGQMQMAIDENNRKNQESDAKVQKDAAETVKTYTEIDLSRTKQQLEEYKLVLDRMQQTFDQQNERMRLEVESGFSKEFRQ